MSQNGKRKRRARHLSPAKKLLLVTVLLIVFALCGTTFLNLSAMDEEDAPATDASGWTSPIHAYVMAEGGSLTAPFYNDGFAVVGEYGRGTGITLESWEPFVTESGDEFYHAYLDGRLGYIPCANVTDNQLELLQETQIYVRSAVNLLLNPGEPTLGPLVTRGSLLRLMGYDYFRDDGTVNMYQVKVGDDFGWIKSDYVAFSYDDAMKNWSNEYGSYSNHVYRGNEYGAGNAAELDYWPHEKGDFADEGNAMPESVYALYASADDVNPQDVQALIDLAQGTPINAIVFTIMDSGGLAYPASSLERYGLLADGIYPCYQSRDEFAKAVQMAQDAGFYTVARISAFDDVPLAKTHPEWAITDFNGTLIPVSDSYWPSPYSREVWELKVGLAVEVADEFGFNEIQFDFVRFPHFIPDNADLKNRSGESMAQALQRFLTYACDVLHDHGVYVASNMFCETANEYVAPCGQYWAAESTVVDVICGQPFPEDFGSSYYRKPYSTIYEWALHVSDRQSECSTPAVVRTWVQTKDMRGYKYDHVAIQKEIVALYDADLTGGYMLWHQRGTLYAVEDVVGAIEYDYTALYNEAIAAERKLSKYMGIDTVE